MRPGVLRAGVLGGLLGGLVSAVPYVNSLNSCCCALVVLSGVFAAWTLVSDAPQHASAGACAQAGWLAGALAGFASLPLGGLLGRLVFGVAGLEDQVQQASADLARLGLEIPPEAAAMSLKIQRAVVGLDLNGWTLFAACVSAVLFSFFGLMGGAIGHSIFRGSRAKPPAIPPVVPGPPPAPAEPPELPELPPVEGHGELPFAELPELPRHPDAPPPGPPDDGAGDPDPGDRRSGN